MNVGYARCSTVGQDHDLQIDGLKRAGCERIFIETASGTKADRPVLAEALAFVRPGDVLVVYSLSRLARSVRHLIEVGEDLRVREIGLASITESIDTSTVSGRFLFTILGAMSQMEVELLRERTRHGLQAARARGRVGGRPRVLDEGRIEIARTLLANDRLTVAQVAEQVGCSSATLYRHLGGARRLSSSAQAVRA
ncbi:recombinase family protein [Salinarimonas ramus]|uniref:Invertase n=1 Tax=Salinarimonas ramus TaxID=690164 RepID=A0A917QL21_9HYPH|nr:recombinase family protein [Salinarimonas ramus]GGK55743.1 invertase [Salinarimonas ramus]